MDAELEPLIARLRQEPADRLEEIERESEIPVSTLRKLRAETWGTRNPTWRTVKRLRDYYASRRGKRR